MLSNVFLSGLPRGVKLKRIISVLKDPAMAFYVACDKASAFFVARKKM